MEAVPLDVRSVPTSVGPPKAHRPESGGHLARGDNIAKEHITI
jgi:hypothetical protein